MVDNIRAIVIFYVALLLATRDLDICCLPVMSNRFSYLQYKRGEMSSK